MALPDLIGSQEPTIHLAPAYETSAGAETVELAKAAGLLLDPWQQSVLRDGLAERADGYWAAFEVGCLVARQNGKGGIFEARVLAGLFLLGERLILYSAHEFKTSAEMFRRILGLIEGTAVMRKRVKTVSRSKGEEGIELTTGQRLRFLARSKGSGRGFSGDCNILDEAQILGDAALDALMPTMSARPNPQLWYGGSAPDHQLAECGPLTRLRKRAMAGAEGIAYSEWSADLCSDLCPPDCGQHDRADDPAVWAKTNPALGRRISVEHVARELESMGTKGFARERLSVGNYPSDGGGWDVISQDAWSALADRESKPGQPVAFALDVTPDRANAAIAVAGRTESGRLHVEVVEHRSGTHWVVEHLVRLTSQWKTCAVVLDAAGPAGSLLAPLEAEGVEVVRASARIVTQACGQFFDAVRDGELRHIEQGPLTAAVEGARRRPLGDAWAWDRKGPTVDISPLVAATLAAWGHTAHAHLSRSRDVLANIW